MSEHTVENFLHLFLQTNDFNRLVNEAALVLKNPLLVCDTSYHFIAHSPVEHVKDESWQRGIKLGSWSYERVSMIGQLDLDYSGGAYKTQILTNINELSAARRKIGTLCIEGSHLGYYMILEENAPFDEVDEAVYRQVEMVLAKCLYLERPFRLPGKNESCENIIIDLLQSHFESEKLFLKRAEKSELACKGDYRVFCIDIKDYCADTRGTRSVVNGKINDIHSVVGQCMPLSWQVQIRDYIVVLANFSSRFFQSDILMEGFSAFLKENHLFVGYSDLFSNPYHLKRYFEQAKSALHLGCLSKDHRRMIPYEDYKLFSLFSNLKDTDVFLQYSTEAIRRICEYDMENETEYFETVYHYLGSSLSLKKTAQKLYLHRNTVAYRIGYL